MEQPPPSAGCQGKTEGTNLHPVCKQSLLKLRERVKDEGEVTDSGDSSEAFLVYIPRLFVQTLSDVVVCQRCPEPAHLRNPSPDYCGSKSPKGNPPLPGISVPPQCKSRQSTPCMRLENSCYAYWLCQHPEKTGC